MEAGLLAIGLGIINRKLTFIKDTPFSGLKLYSSGRTETLIVQGHSINIYGVNETQKEVRNTFCSSINLYICSGVSLVPNTYTHTLAPPR